MKRLVITATIVVLLVALFVTFQKSPETRQQEAALRLSNIEIVDESEERIRGLSGRESIPDDYGMLFVFLLPDNYGFWMKDMKVAIDIIWLSDDGMILGVDENVTPDTYPESFYPPRPVRYVLETRAGLVKERGWHVGTVLDLPLP